MNKINEQKSRIEYLDIAKSLGIIAVVYAHARGIGGSYMWHFHMPLFFFISGLLYSEQSNLKTYIIRKIKALYIPFVFWNLLFYVVKQNLLTRKIAYKNIFLMFLGVYKEGDFLGATWFLAALFQVTILYKVLDCSLKHSKCKDIILILLFICFAIIGFDITLPYKLSRTVILSVFFAIGVFIQKNKNLLNNIDSVILALVCGVMFYVISRANYVNMGDNEYRYCIEFVIGAFAAIYIIIFVSKRLANSLNGITKIIKLGMIYLGRYSIDIVIWQFVAFKLVIIVQMYQNDEVLSFSNLVSYHSVYNVSNGWWLVYTLVGIFIPLLWGSFLRFGLWMGKNILNKLHII